MQSEIERAVTDYEMTFSQNSGQNSNTFQKWKDKYKYISDFISFPYRNLRIEKSFKNTIEKYFKYITNSELQN